MEGKGYKFKRVHVRRLIKREVGSKRNSKMGLYYLKDRLMIC